MRNPVPLLTKKFEESPENNGGGKTWLSSHVGLHQPMASSLSITTRLGTWCPIANEEIHYVSICLVHGGYLRS